VTNIICSSLSAACWLTVTVSFICWLWWIFSVCSASYHDSASVHIQYHGCPELSIRHRTHKHTCMHVHIQYLCSRPQL
jgi:hypothetical protein